MWEEFAVPSQGDCVDLSTRIYLDHHQPGSIAGEKLESCEKSYFAIRHTLCVQETFGLDHGFNPVGEYDVDAILGVLVGCGAAMVLVRSLG